MYMQPVEFPGRGLIKGTSVTVTYKQGLLVWPLGPTHSSSCSICLNHTIDSAVSETLM